MRNVIFVTKVEGLIKRKCFVYIDKVVGIEVPVNNVFRLYFDNAVWLIPAEEFDMVMHVCVPYYKELEEYKDYIKTK